MTVIQVTLPQHAILAHAIDGGARWQILDALFKDRFAGPLRGRGLARGQVVRLSG